MYYHYLLEIFHYFKVYFNYLDKQHFRKMFKEKLRYYKFIFWIYTIIYDNNIIIQYSDHLV